MDDKSSLKYYSVEAFELYARPECKSRQVHQKHIGSNMCDIIELNLPATIRTLRREIERLQNIIETGINGYCPCCGAPNKINIGQEHDEECIWYVSDGPD